MSSKPAPKNALGPVIKEIRASRGWTLEQVAERLRSEGWTCSAARLDRIERQKVTVKDFEVFYLCAALETSLDDLWRRLKLSKTSQ